MFDRMEPFMPIRVGFNMIREPADSGVDYRRLKGTRSEIDLGLEGLECVIEYGVWWDWDIEHLYELEAIWVYLGEDSSVLRLEASWHGGFNEMSCEGKIPRVGDIPVVFSQPGKHAFAPDPGWFTPREEMALPCKRNAGSGGVHVTPLFEGRIEKTPEHDELVSRYLRARAFQPTFEFDKEWRMPEGAFVEWDQLREWIPGRVAEIIARLRAG